MPREERRIFFDHDEAYKAVQLLCADKGLPRPPLGEVKDADISVTDVQQIAFIVIKEKTGMEVAVPYSRDFILAALMTMCNSIGIPLPKGANKSLEVMPGKLTVRVQMIRKQS